MKRYTRYNDRRNGLVALFVLLALLMPWAAKAQTITLADYTFWTGVDTTKWITMSSPTTLVVKGKDEVASSLTDITFSFPFGAGSYEKFYVNSNGLFSFDTSESPGTGQYGSNFTTDVSMRYPKISGVSGNDLTTGNNGYVKYEVTGASPNRVLVCEYFTNKYVSGSSGTNTSATFKWQVQLHEAGAKVVIVYGAGSSIPSSFQIGLGQNIPEYDIWLVNPADHVATHYDARLNTKFSAWPSKGRYYEFARPMAVPYSENFDSYTSGISSGAGYPTGYPAGDMPANWCFLNRSISTSDYPMAFLSSSSTYAVSGNCLFFKSSSSTPLYSILPKFTEEIADLVLCFTYKNEGVSAYNGTLHVGYMTDPKDPSTFILVKTCEQTTTKTPVGVSFKGVPAGSRIAFKYEGGSDDNYYLGIDNVYVTDILPTKIVASSPDPSNGEMTWEQFASFVNSGVDYSDETVTLEANITVTTMVGTMSTQTTLGQAFKGTFDGQGHTLTVDLTNGSNYDGDDAKWSYTAPFCCISDATIKDLKVMGTISNAYKGAAGLAGFVSGTCTIQNCVVGAEIKSTFGSSADCDATNGGFFSNLRGTTNVRGCAFTGKMTTTNDSYEPNSCGGFAGWNAGTVKFYDCVYAPSADPTISTTGCCTFSRGSSGVNIYNCYYTQTLNTAQGQKLEYTISGGSNVTVALNGGTEYNVSGITGFNKTSNKAIFLSTNYGDHNDQIYSANSNSADLNLGYTGSDILTGYTLSNGSFSSGSAITGNNDPYTLSMTANNTIISATVIVQYTITASSNNTSYGTVTGGGVYDADATVTLEATPTANGYFYKWSDGETTTTHSAITASGNATYTAIFVPKNIASTTDWNNFADVVSGTGSYSGYQCDYSGKTVTMTADVGTVNTMVGTSTGDKCFRGIFDGGCHTLTFSKSVSTQYCAPFCRIDGATIQNLKTAGSVTMDNVDQRYLAGIVAYTKGSSQITNCISSMVMTHNRNGDSGSGGIVGQIGSSSTCTIKGCVFNGTMAGANSTYWGGIVGYYNSGNTAIVEDCIFAPTSLDIGGNSTTIARDRGGSQTVTNCYYNQEGAKMANKQGKRVYTISAGSNTTVALTGTKTDHDYTSACSGTGLVFYDGDSDSSFDDGFSFNDGSTTTLYAAGDVTAHLLLGATAPANNTLYSYSVTSSNGGTLSGSAITGTNDAYTLTMTAYDQTVSANFIDMTTGDTWVTAINSYGMATGLTTSTSGASISAKEGFAYLISMVNDLNDVEDPIDFKNKTVTLTSDIDMTGHDWVPIGTVEHPFRGTFDGNGHTITGITRSTEFPHMGLFGYTEGATIQNVIVDADFSGNSNTMGAIVGTLANSSAKTTGTVAFTEAAGSIAGGALTTAIGGLVGSNEGGTVHSSFAVNTLTAGATSTEVGGLVGNNDGHIYNCYSNVTISTSPVNPDVKGGLVGVNGSGKEIVNCYAILGSQTFPAFAYTNNGTISYCYAPSGKSYCNTEGTLQYHGTYVDPAYGIKHLDYMYRDNLVTVADGTSNSYVKALTHNADNHTPEWGGLVSVLNQYVAANSGRGYAQWYRPLTTNINGDLPVLGFPEDSTLVATSTSGNYLQYSSSLDDLLAEHASNTAYMFHYGTASDVEHVPGSNVHVYINEDAVLLQATSPDPGAFANTTVGVTFDNSDHGQHSNDYWGNQLLYDWHLMSTPLSGLKTGAVHGSYVAGDPNVVDITSIGGYFPDGLITVGNPAVDGAIKWDFYSYYEPAYHWINLKRNKNNHYHQDYSGVIDYDQDDQDTDRSSAYYIPGKGYMMAISQNTFMNASGTLNRGNVSITLTKKEPDGINYQPGANLVGNPYQGYLNLAAITDKYSVLDKFYIYDADQGVYAPVVDGSSSNPVIPSKYIHPHQAFFVLAPTDDMPLEFEPTMAGTTMGSGSNSHFRDEEQPDYPLVNLFAEDAMGHRDLTVIEFHRPELGGAEKINYLHSAPFTIAAHYDHVSYGILFATGDIDRVPVRFKTEESGTVTLTWNTYNGEFYELRLIDNKPGVDYDMLANTSYTFEASPEDYASRFYIVYDCSGTGIDENEYNSSTGSGSFAYIGIDGNIIIDAESYEGVSLQMIDMMGRVLYSTTVNGEMHTISTNGLAKGVYLLRLTKDNMMKTQKIVVR